MILMIDNYDSFTYNLVQYLEELGREVAIAANDEITLDRIDRLEPDAILISPGLQVPTRPVSAWKRCGVSITVILFWESVWDIRL